MSTPDLSSIRRAVQLRDRCRTAAVAASQRVGEPMSPAQANVAFDAMVDLIRDHDSEAARPAEPVQYGHAGRHHGVGTPDCPSELHHHHDERCEPPAEKPTLPGF